jgi:hypothetical protein
MFNRTDDDTRRCGLSRCIDHWAARNFADEASHSGHFRALLAFSPLLSSERLVAVPQPCCGLAAWMLAQLPKFRAGELIARRLASARRELGFLHRIREPIAPILSLATQAGGERRSPDSYRREGGGPLCGYWPNGVSDRRLSA